MNIFTKTQQLSFETADLKSPKASSAPATIGQAIRLIIGGRAAHIKNAAKKLDIPVQTLSEIINEKTVPTRSFLERKDLREKLRTEFPVGWAHYGDDYDRFAAQTKPKKTQGLREPRDKDSFGYTLWLLCGGANGHSNDACALLGILPQQLSGYLHGRSLPSPRVIREHKWREVFAARNPRLWDQCRDDFEARLKKRARGNANPLMMLWQEAAAFITGELDAAAHTHDSIAAEAQTVALRNPEIWQRLCAGDGTLGKSLYRSALKEVCRICIYAGRPADKAAHAAKLAAQFRIGY